jgi:hypothetical protein
MSKCPKIRILRYGIQTSMVLTPSGEVLLILGPFVQSEFDCSSLCEKTAAAGGASISGPVVTNVSGCQWVIIPLLITL